MEIEDPKLLQQALDDWGQETQIDVCIEELSELIHALARYQQGRYDAKDVEEEIGDVELVLEQLHMIFDPDNIQESKNSKMAILREKLDSS